MNVWKYLLKHLECWWNKEHIYATFYDKHQRPQRKCIRWGRTCKGTK